MATTHSLRRPQRPARGTTTATGNVRPHRPKPARQKRSDAASSEAPSLAPEILPVIVEAAVVKAVRPIRAGDSDDHLAAYFRQLAVHELLTPEDERELSQGIEDTEILTWERVLCRADVVRPLLAMIEPNLEQAISFPKLQKVLDEMLKSKRARKDEKLTKKLRACAREAALELRKLDLDRVHIDAVVRELYRAREAASAGTETWWTDGDARDAGAYFDEVRQAHRDAGNLRDEFVRANLRLVVTMARRYDRGGMPLADLIQEGNLGLLKAVERYDYRRGFRFSTYASWWIRHAISRALADKGREIRLPVHMIDAQHRVTKARRMLTGQLGRQPTSEELAKATQMPVDKIEKMRSWLLEQSVSIDKPVGDDEGRVLGEVLEDPDREEISPTQDLEWEALTTEVRSMLGELRPIEADILRQRFGLGTEQELTLKEIGDKYNLSRERIRQLQEQALAKMRRALARRDLM